MLAVLLAITTLGTYAAHAVGVVTECGAAVPMSDGVELSANIQRPAGTGRYPVILTSTGYNKDSGNNSPTCGSLGGSMISRGYAVMLIDERGTGASEGTWDMWGPRMQRDYQEMLDWIQRQPWSNGSVGVIGASYMAITSVFLAEADAARIARGKPRAVRAVWAWTPAFDLYRDLAGPGGGSASTFYVAFVALVTGQNAAPPSDPAAFPAWADRYASRTAGGSAFAAEVLGRVVTGDHYDGKFWQDRSPSARASTITAPVAVIGGWYDIFQRGEPLLVQAMTRSKHSKLWMGPSYHQGIPAAAWAAQRIGGQGEIIRKWWEKWLKGANNGVEKLPAVNVYRVGTTGWRHATSWPVSGTRYTRYYLGGPRGGTSPTSLNDGLLTLAKPAAGSPGDVLPMTQLGGGCSRSQGQWTAAGVTTGTPCDTDNRLAEVGSLTYTTAPVTRATEVTGPVNAHFWAELVRPDATLAVTLSDVAPDGTSTQLTAGWLNVAQRALDAKRSQRDPITKQVVLPFHPFTRATLTPATPGVAVEVDVEVFPASFVLQPGHRLRVSITPGDAPHMVPTATTAAAGAGGIVTILRDAAHPSYVLLPLQR